MSDEEKKENIKDTRFKDFMHKSDVLSWMLRTNIAEFKDMSIDDIKKCLVLGEGGKTVIGRETEYTSKRGASYRLDTVFDVTMPDSEEQVKVIVGIEGQIDPKPGYPIEKRAEFYLAKMVASQADREFVGRHYEKIRRCYSIWCLMDPRADMRNTIVHYTFRPGYSYGISGEPPYRFETFNVVLLGVGRYDSTLPESLALVSALFSKIGAEDRRELLDERFKISLDDDELKWLDEMTTLDLDFKERYTREGWEKGVEEGRKEGRKEGRDEERKKRIDSLVSVALIVREEGETVEHLLDRLQIPEDIRSDVEKGLRERTA